MANVAAHAAARRILAVSGMSVSLPASGSEGIALRRFFDLELLDNRYPSLHGMRVLAIVSVVQYHVTMLFTFTAGLPVDPQWGMTSMTVFFGMDLFFVLSGFLIGSILFRSVESKGSQHVRRFYLRRAFRTFPSYYVVLTFLTVTATLTAAQWHHLWLEYVYLTNYRMPLVPGDLVMPWGWSLALEEQFYLTVPLLFLLLRKLRSDRARLTVLGVLWAGALVVRLVLCLRHPEWNERALYNFLYYRTHTRFDTLVAGIILAYVQNRWHAPMARWLESPHARAALALPSLACLWLLMRPWMFGERAVPWMHVVSWGTLTSIMYFGWVLLLLNGGSGWIQRALSAPVFRRLATLGYGVYLLHLPLCIALVTPVAVSLLNRRGWPMLAVWPIAVALLLMASFSASYVLHLLVEKPALRLRDRYAR
jgi:peptidoglycan/LPS O-acetylase OafA/YrhL